eukprot:s2497_g11.t1
MDSLLSLEQDIEPYVVQWPSQAEADGVMEVSALVAMKRPDGVMLVFPKGVLPEDEVASGNLHGGGILGPSIEFTVPSVIIENGLVSATGDTVEVLVVDCLADVIALMREFRAFEEIVYGFDLENPYALPDPNALLDAILQWIQDADPSHGLGFYTADEQAVPDGTPQGPVTPKTKAPARRREATGSATPARPGTGGLPEGSKPKNERAKKVTTASLAASMEVLMNQIPDMASQLASIAEKQRKMENQILAPVSASCPALSQPLSHVVRGQPLEPSVLAKQVAPPPRTATLPSPGILRSPALAQPAELAALEQEKLGSLAHREDHPLAQAVLAQSQALTNLVSQIAAGSSDPMLDLSGASTTGTRGSAGRAKLQAELASQKGLFFASVMQSMARRMNPTAPVSSSPMELMDKGICGTKYLERFGGYGRHRDLGQIQYQVMQILDYLQMENVAAARDATALLAVTLEQAVMDNGRFDLAAVLCLQDDLPSNIFVNRNAGAFSRSRSFSPLADQRWVTIALAYLKELDAIQSKRAELAGPSQKPTPGNQNPSSAQPKQKAGAKRKGRGKGAQQASQASVEENEEV